MLTVCEKPRTETTQQIAVPHGIPWISGKRQPPSDIYIYIHTHAHYIYILYMYQTRPRFLLAFSWFVSGRTCFIKDMLWFTAVGRAQPAGREGDRCPFPIGWLINRGV